MYELKFQKEFLKTFHKYVKKDKLLNKALVKTLEILRGNPFDNSLNTHKVDTRKNRDIYSSRVSGDWRLAWIFDKENKSTIIICLELGTHSGANQIYKNKSS